MYGGRALPPCPCATSHPSELEVIWCNARPTAKASPTQQNSSPDFLRAPQFSPRHCFQRSFLQNSEPMGHATYLMRSLHPFSTPSGCTTASHTCIPREETPSCHSAYLPERHAVDIRIALGTIHIFLLSSSICNHPHVQSG